MWLVQFFPVFLIAVFFFLEDKFVCTVCPPFKHKQTSDIEPPPTELSPSSLRVAKETAGQDRIASVDWADLQLVLERSVLDGAHAPKVSALPAPPLALIQW